MKRALVSVSDKTNLIEFVSGLKELGYEIEQNERQPIILEACGKKGQ